MCRVRFLAVQRTDHAVRRGPRNRDLTADMGVPLFHETSRLICDLDRLTPRGMDIDGRGGPAATTEQVVDGHPSQFSLDVPERHVDAGDGIVQHWPTPPVGAD